MISVGGGWLAERCGVAVGCQLTFPPVSTLPDLGSALIVSPMDGRRAPHTQYNSTQQNSQ